MSFSGDVRLARHVDPDERDGSYAAPSAFMMSAADLKAKKPYLSVNACDVQHLTEIVATYAKRQGGSGEVAVCIHQVFRYVAQGRRAGATIVSRRTEPRWHFPDTDGDAPAFLRRPNQNNPSHCGVEFLRSFNDLQQRNFARRMAQNPRMQVFPAGSPA